MKRCLEIVDKKTAVALLRTICPEEKIYYSPHMLIIRGLDYEYRIPINLCSFDTSEDEEDINN